MTHLKPRTTTVTLYQGDDMDRLASLYRKVQVLEALAAEKPKGEPRRLGDEDTTGDALRDARQEYDTFLDEAATRAVDVELQSIGKRRFRDLIAEHPPRRVDSEPDEDGKVTQVIHPDDIEWGTNYETFSRALLTYRDSDKITITKPEFGSSADVQAFVDDELADGDHDRLFNLAALLNQAPSVDPQSRRFS